MTAEQLVRDLRQREPAAGSAVTVEVHDTLACVVCDVTILVLEAQATAVRPTCCGRTMRTVRPAPCSTPTPRGVAAGTSPLSIVQINAKDSQQRAIALVTSEATVRVQ